MIAYVIFNFPSIYLIEKQGLRFTTLFSVILQMVGYWIRTIDNHKFAWSVLGQSIAAISNPFIFNMINKVSAIWFPVEERMLATTITVCATYLGSIQGFYQPLYFVKTEVPERDHHGKAQETIQQEIGDLLRNQAIIQLIIFIICYFWMIEPEIEQHPQDEAEDQDIDPISVNDQSFTRRSIHPQTTRSVR